MKLLYRCRICGNTFVVDNPDVKQTATGYTYKLAQTLEATHQCPKEVVSGFPVGIADLIAIERRK